MASKALLLLLACLLLFNTTVLQGSSEWKEEIIVESGAIALALSPIYMESPTPSPLCPPPAPLVGEPPHPPLAKPPGTTLECIPQCTVRCKNNSRKNICLRACVTCCKRCNCVPPGQYGNREKCGKCYTEMTTSGGRLKCP